MIDADWVLGRTVAQPATPSDGWLSAVFKALAANPAAGPSSTETMQRDGEATHVLLLPVADSVL